MNDVKNVFLVNAVGIQEGFHDVLILANGIDDACENAGLYFRNFLVSYKSVHRINSESLRKILNSKCQLLIENKDL